MSHTVTVTRTMTTTTTSAIIINSGYLKTWPGIFKLFQLILGIVIVGLVSYYYSKYRTYNYTPETFFLLMAVTFLVGTFLLLLSCLISISTASVIPKTIYEVVYHGFAFILYLAASITFIIEVNHYKNSYSNIYDAYFAAAILPLGYFSIVTLEIGQFSWSIQWKIIGKFVNLVIGLVLSGLYLLSTIFALRSYRGL